MQIDRTLIATGAVGAVLAALCCATPLLALLFGALGLSAWLTGANDTVVPVLLLSAVLAGVGFYRRASALTRRRPVASHESEHHE